jgi:DMSO/TMAO reductase YedYZ heme-binding membrane subunit
MTSNQFIRWIAKPALFLASLGPAAWLVAAAVHGWLSVNPLADVTNQTGVWTLRLLWVTLAVVA